MADAGGYTRKSTRWKAGALDKYLNHQPVPLVVCGTVSVTVNLWLSGDELFMAALAPPYPWCSACE
jgi:hypothetical protein